MIFTESPLQGAFIVDLQPHEDKRGFFARAWCHDEFKRKGLDVRIAQCNISSTKSKGTLRGMHYQAKPCPEAKFIRCIRGVIYNVIIDLRPERKTFKRWFSIELTSENKRALFVPIGFAHGFQTLEDDCEVFYQMSEFYHPEYARGIRWNDPAFGIKWPLSNPILSLRDQSFPDFK